MYLANYDHIKVNKLAQQKFNSDFNTCCCKEQVAMKRQAKFCNIINNNY